MAKTTQKANLESRAFLKEHLAKGSTVSTNLVKVSRDGMSRSLAAFIVIDGEIRNVSRQVAETIGYRFSVAKNAVLVPGCGMDMGFHLVYVLSSTLFNEEIEQLGYALKQKWI